MYQQTDIKKTASELVNVVKASMHYTIDVNIDCSGIEHNFVLADHFHTDSVLMNVISNAIKLAPKDGTVDFIINETSSSRNDYCAYDFIIENNESIISDEDFEYIHDILSGQKDLKSSETNGMGWGPSITKKLVNLLDGTISIERKQNHGLRTVIRLELEIIKNDISSEQPKQDESYGEFSLNGKKVLLVEDNDLNREILEDILCEEGIIVDSAEDGDIAVEKMRSAQPGQYDIILMDIQMPTMNGYDATRAIRALPDSHIANIPIVAVTANAFEEDRQEAFRSGMNEHLAKPVEVDKLLNMLEMFLR